MSMSTSNVSPSGCQLQILTRYSYRDVVMLRLFGNDKMTTVFYEAEDRMLWYGLYHVDSEQFFSCSISKGAFL